MKKILTLIAILFTLNCSAYDTTQVKPKTQTTSCCKKHKSVINQMDSVTIEKCRAKKVERKKIVRRSLLWVGVMAGLVIVVHTGVLIK